MGTAQMEKADNTNPGGNRGLQQVQITSSVKNDSTSEPQCQPQLQPIVATKPNPTETLKAALAYHDAGYRLVPVQAPGRVTKRGNTTEGKEPHFLLIERRYRNEAKELGLKTNSPRLCYLRPLDEKSIKEFFVIDPTCNIAIHIGEDDDLVDLDFDSGQIPPELWDILSPAVAMQSGRGYHLIYGYPDKHNLPPVLEWHGADIAEVRKTGLIIVPPSLHISGTLRQWLPGMSLCDSTPCQLPDAVIPYLHRKWRGTSNRQPSKAVGGASNITSQSDYQAKLPLPGAETIPEAVEMVCRHFGVYVSLDRKTHSPFPGKSDTKPSLVLAQMDGGAIWLRDFGGDNRIGHWITPAQVVRGKITGDYSRLLSAGLQKVWFTRGLLESGYYPNPPDVKSKPLESKVGSRPVSQGLRKLYEGLVLRQRVAMVLDGFDPVFTFSWRFALDWCGLKSMKQVKSDMGRLIADGYLFVARVVNNQQYYSLFEQGVKPASPDGTENEKGE